MSDPKRYSIVADYQAPWAKMHEFSAGGWVKWEDYARLKAEVERLTQNTDKLCKHGDLEIARLKAENARLRKAGDALADAAYAHCMCQDCEELRDQWRDAKRGDQP